MSGSKTKKKQSNRLDRFLFYAKFVVLIVVAVLFVIAYSFSYKDFPVSTAQYKIPHGSDDNQEACSSIKLLIVMDSNSKYINDSYTDFYLVRDLLKQLPDINYDVTIVNNNTPDFTVLNNMSENLLLRIYQEKQYQYIMALGDDAIEPAKEIKELFYPDSKLLLYGVTSKAAHDALTPVSSVNSNIANTMTIAYAANPTANRMIFLYDDNNYSDIMINIIKNKKQYFDEVSFVMLNANKYSANDAINHINRSKNNNIVFYVSFLTAEEDRDLEHSEIINNFKSEINTPIYDLSPITQGNDIRNSIRYYPYEVSNEPLAYIGLMPEDVCITGYEMIEYAAANLTPLNDENLPISHYESCYSFINWCMQDIGLTKHPDNLSEFVEYCQTNSEFILEDQVKPGDFIFISSTENNLDSVDDIYVYVSENIVIGVNEYGILSFTKPSEEKYQVAYYHPYTIECPPVES